MSQEDLDALLSRMADIAEAVNKFTSETIQQEAFKALIDAYGGSRQPQEPLSPPPSTTQEAEPAGDQMQPSTVVGASTGKVKRPRKANGGVAKENFTFIRTIDIQPPGQPALRDFMNEKSPASNEAKFVVVAYWFETYGGVPEVTASHIGSAFRMLKEREPVDLAAALRVTSSRQGTLDVSAYPNIRLTPHGRNLVDHDLPLKGKKK